MPHTSLRKSGITRRLLNAALAALLVSTTLALIPGATPPAEAFDHDSGVVWTVDYWITFAPEDQETQGPGTTVNGQETGKALVGVTVYEITLGDIHASCSDRFNLYDDSDVRLNPLPSNWGYGKDGSPTSSEP
ncbi:MAG: hypothetical protein QGD89_01310, partial [Actinomycetota bacterium]|nr:hypothetical protein [Actinomycetota bacterium]